MSNLDPKAAKAFTRLIELNAQITELSREADDLKAQLRTALAAGDYTIKGQPALRIQPQRRFDPESGYALIPEELKRECLSVSIDASKVKQHLTPAQLDTCMVESGQPKVVAL